MGNTHFSGSILASGAAGRGLFQNFPIELMGRVDHFLYFNDFVAGEGDYDDTADWTENSIGTPTSASAGILTDTRHGVLLVDAGAAANTGIQTEFTGSAGAGEFCVPTDGKSFLFGAGFKRNIVSAGSIWVGLGETRGTSTILTVATGELTNLPNGIGFWVGDSSPSTLLLVNKRLAATSGTLIMAPLSANTYVHVAFRVDVFDLATAESSGTITGYIKRNGVWQRVGRTSADTVPDTGLCPQVAVKNGATGTLSLNVDYIWYAEQR